MQTTEQERYPHDIVVISKAVTGGKGRAGNAIRGWYRQGRIEGARQRQKNAKIWFSDRGVVEAWELWADHKALDPVKDMPTEVRKMKQRIDSAGAVGFQTQGAPDGQLTVTVYVPKGVNLNVVQQA